MKKLSIAVVSILLMAGNLTSFAELYYFNHTKHTFLEDKGVQYNYLCEKTALEAIEKNTAKRALKAHQYMQSEIQRVAQEYIDTPSFKDAGGDTMYADALKKMQISIRQISQNIEEKFQCMYIGKSKVDQ